MEVLKSKIEISMTKADTSINWATLEKSGKVAAPNWSVPTDPAVAHQYPTSFKTPKDWSKVNQELAELEQKGELEDGDPLQVREKIGMSVKQRPGMGEGRREG